MCDVGLLRSDITIRSVELPTGKHNKHGKLVAIASKFSRGFASGRRSLNRSTGGPSTSTFDPIDGSDLHYRTMQDFRVCFSLHRRINYGLRNI